MSPERWRQIEEIYHSALERPVDARVAFMDEACGADTELRREVESLLRQGESKEALVDRPAWEAAAELLDTRAKDRTGQVISHYKMLEKLGEGGMGQVYRAHDPRTRRDVAVKVCAGRFTDRFSREVHAVAALNHSNICHLYDVGPDYLVMELCEGETLEARLKRGKLSIPETARCGAQIADALSAAHAKGIVHRDLKPGNVMLTKAGVKVLDFGVAKIEHRGADEEHTHTMTAAGAILGTVQYMSPEQAQGKEVDARSDIFSFGLVLYEMLTGKPAFEGPNPASIIAAILEREPAPLDVTLPLDRVIRTCLAKDPDQRFQTVLDLKRALNWALEQPPASATAKPGRRWWIAAAALLIGALGGWGVSRLRQPPAEARPYRLQITPPEGSRFAFGNNAGGVALSPDGHTAAFVASGSGKNGLWVRPLDGAAAHLIAGTEGAAYPFWSPDGKSVAFFLGSKLLRVDLADGAPSAICDVAVPRGGAWDSDGQILFGVLAGGLFRVPASGGTPAPLTTLDAARGESYHRWPQVLPGGRFLYFVQSAKPENSGTYAASFAKPGERVRLSKSDTNALYAPGGDGKNYLLWLRGGTLVAQELDTGTLALVGEPHAVADPVARIGILGQMNVTVSFGGLLLYSDSNTLSQFTWLDRTGKPLGMVGEPGEYSTFRLSPDGRRVISSMDRPGSTDLWLLEVERGVAGRFTSNAGFSTYPIWSADGRAILFSSAVPRNLFRKESSGAGNQRRLSQSPNNQFATDWSRDGRWVLYHEIIPGTQRDLWVLPVTSEGQPAPDATPRAYLRTPVNESNARFSPEAPPRWVAYQSDETGRAEVYIQAFPEPRGATRISTGGGQYPQWGAGARELFYVSPDNRLMAVSLKLGADTVEPSAPRELFVLPMVEAGWSPYDITPDGQRFLVRATPGQAAQPLTVIVNWPALLKKEAPAP